MKRAVVILRNGDKLSVYVPYQRRRPSGAAKSNHEIRHWLNVKEALYGCYFTTFNPEMNFANALEAGYEMILDKRHENTER